MKVTINLSVSSVKGITEYLKNVYDNENVSKFDIQDYINSIVDTTIHSQRESVSDYINKLEV